MHIPVHLEQLELDAAVSLHVCEGQLVESRQQKLHVREERFEGACVVVTQSRIQSMIETRLL